VPHFQVEGEGDGGIRHLLSATIKAIISDSGLAGCGRIKVGADPLSFTLAGGAGIHWNPSLLLGPAAILANLHLFTGCDLSDYETVVAPRDAAAAAGTRVFTVGRGLQLLTLRVQGLGAAPKVALQGPGGVTIDLTGADNAHTPRGLGLRVDSEDRSFFLVAHPPAGVWRIVPAADSVRVVAVQRAGVLPQPKVSGRVTGTGAKRTLHYRIARIPGQLVRFVEAGDRGGQTLRAVRIGGSGAVSFVPAPARGSRRTILAIVEQNGMPRARLTVASFSAGSPHVGPVPGLRVRRAGRTAIVTWRGAFYATGYDIVATFTTGTRELLSTGGAARRIVVRGLAPSAGLTVAVMGIHRGGLRGRPSSARLAPPKPKPKPKRRR
jgi:hypothetical protein